MSERKTIFTPSVLMGIKVFILFILVLVLQAPLYSIKSLIHERQGRSDEAEKEVISQFGGQQIISGPLLVLSWKEFVAERNVVREAVFTPEDLNIDSSMTTETRQRGIFSIPVYSVKTDMKGYFSFPDLDALNIPARDVLWDKSFISFDLSDMRGLSGDVQCSWNGQAVGLDGGTSKSGLMDRSLFFKPQKMQPGGKYEFLMSMTLKGGHQLDYIAAGKKTQITMRSDWPDPSFNGSRLPDKRELSDDGFTASWTVLSLSRNFPDSWRMADGMEKTVMHTKFGMQLYSAVDHYLLSERSVKYGLLFVILPFLCFFIFETVWKLRIHFFQYLLVGVCELVFFLLLLSLSEHIGFNLSFLIASVLTVAAISYYANVFVRDRGKTLFITALLLVSYVFLFVIIQNEDYALLIGASGVFLIVVMVMLVTRKVDWYRIGKTLTDNIKNTMDPGSKT